MYMHMYFQGIPDSTGGKSAHSRLLVTAQLAWNKLTITCTRVQDGFETLTKTTTLYVLSKHIYSLIV